MKYNSGDVLCRYSKNKIEQEHLAKKHFKDNKDSKSLGPCKEQMYLMIFYCPWLLILHQLFLSNGVNILELLFDLGMAESVLSELEKNSFSCDSMIISWINYVI